VVGTAAALAGLIARRRLETVAMGVAVVALFAAPAVWSSTVFKNANNGTFPGAGPNYLSGASAVGGAPGGAGFGRRAGGPPAFGGGARPGGPPSGGGRGFATPRAGGVGGGTTSAAAITTALEYVEAHGATKRFGLIVQNEQEAAAAVIAGEPVASMGGFTGRETVLTNSYLARLISRHEARYFLLGGQTGMGGPGGTSNAAVSTITSICQAVSTTSVSTSSGTLYDCAGKAAAIANAG
jgi:hypothetical protein